MALVDRHVGHGPHFRQLAEGEVAGNVEGVFCVAATFLDHAGRCAGAVSATGIRSDMPAWRLEELGQTIRSSADQVAGVLAGKKLTLANTDPQGA